MSGRSASPRPLASSAVEDEDGRSSRRGRASRAGSSTPGLAALLLRPEKRKRDRVELRQIEDQSSRQVRFSKRRSRLFKKDYELSMLCDAQVALIVFSLAGRLYEFASSTTR